MALAFSQIKPSLSSFSPDASPSSSPKLRPAIVLPGLGNNSGDYDKLRLTLKERGIASVVADVSRLDWLRNAAGLLDGNYWRGTLRPRPVLDWYLKRVDAAIQEAKELAQDTGEGLSLIGHSAGGWLARVYMEEFGRSDISLLLTLGTPHLPPAKGSQGIVDQTRGLLNYVEKNCAKAVYTPELRYVCIAGRYIRGSRFSGNSSEESEVSTVSASLTAEAAGSLSVETTSGFRSVLVGQGYKQVCGRADVWGDGVVPEESAHLDGALNVTLDGIYHSPVGSDDASRPWYGSPEIVDKWIHHLLT